jgi:hypothetical protein
MSELRKFSEIHIDEDCSAMSGPHENGLFFNCRFNKLNGLTLTDCDLNGSRFETNTVRDALGFTLTLGCHSFSGVEYSPLLFDLLIVLMTMSKGNDEKRQKLIDVIGVDRHAVLMKILGRLE